VPAAVLASKYQSEAHQIRRSMRIIEAAWLAHPHPDLADAYAHVRLGDSARQRLVRVETLAAKAPGHIESALAIARAAIDATEFARAREVLAPFTDAPTQRLALLMADIERTEHGDSGRARAWTLRAVRARHDPVWTADGYVSDRWRPVSPVTGRLDAFQWQTPLASLPSDKSPAIEAREFEAREFNAAISAPRRVEPPRAPAMPATEIEPPAEVAIPPAAQDNSPAASAAAAPAVEPASKAAAAPAPTPPPAESPSMSAAPLFRARADIPRDNPRAALTGIPPVIPIIRPPDDPGIDDEASSDEFAEQAGPAQGQAGGWRGFLARWGN
jgi:HemY protein